MSVWCDNGSRKGPTLNAGYLPRIVDGRTVVRDAFLPAARTIAFRMERCAKPSAWVLLGREGGQREDCHAVGTVVGIAAGGDHDFASWRAVSRRVNLGAHPVQRFGGFIDRVH